MEHILSLGVICMCFCVCSCSACFCVSVCFYVSLRACVFVCVRVCVCVRAHVYSFVCASFFQGDGGLNALILFGFLVYMAL